MGPTLETERLLLRVPQASDFDSFAELQVGVFSASRYATGSRTVQQYSIEEI